MNEEAHYPFGNSPWNSLERRDLLVQAAAEGLSATRIAAYINSKLPHSGGPITRNAVIGACHRMGIILNSPIAQRLRIERRVEREAGIVRPPRKKRAPRVARKPSWGYQGPKGVNWTAPKPRPPPVDDVERSPLLIPLIELTSSTCKWPIGDVKEPGFGFCGHPSVEGSPYCGYHKKVSRAPGNAALPFVPKDRNVEEAA
jgi:GcrA cell cycle regulator